MYTYVHTGYISENISKIIFDAQEHLKHKNSRNKKVSIKLSTKYLFIVRSTLENGAIRKSMRYFWKNKHLYEMETECTHFNGTLADIKDSKLLFAIEDVSNSISSQITMADEMKEYKDVHWIPCQEPKCIKSLHYLETLVTNTDARFYIISQDTTFVNFNNVIHLLEKQGSVAAKPSPPPNYTQSMIWHTTFVARSYPWCNLVTTS